MNSDNVTPDGISSVDTNQETSQQQEAPKRRSSRRSTRAAANATAQETAGAASTEEATARTRTRRNRRAPTVEQQGDNSPDTPADVPAEEALRAEVTPLTTQGALVSEGVAGDGAAGEAPATRSRRRRGRGMRETAPDAEPLAGALDEPAPAETFDEADEDATPVIATDEDRSVDETTDAEAPVTAPGRRGRRRGRGRGRGDAPAATESHEAHGGEEQAAAVTLTEEEPAALGEPDGAPLFPAPGETEPPAPILSPAVLRRFDHRDWHVRGSRGTPTAPLARTSQAGQASTTTPAARDTGERYGGERSSRHRRFGERRDERARGGEITAVEPGVSEDIEAPSLAPTPLVTAPAPPIAARSSGPIIMPERDAGLSSVPTTGGQRGSGDRIEQLIASQAALLQQQQQTLQSLASTIARLERTMERLSSGGITAGMPRAGMFVDAPNIIYAAENARINLDYGRMLDFLSRGREMVHAIVYAPVTEDTGHRMENQRFVAPFLQKGYKLVTKPLKRFPDGTAKGNFDIELAIDIVTMSQRLDVVILISGDSDFSRLIELIQSRGVRVEVVAFASNVSWELVQMADVFIDVGQYLHEFQ